MLKQTDNLLGRLTNIWIAGITLMMIALVGAIDHWTGFELSFSIFYLIPVSIASWYTTDRFGYAICVISAATWLVIDLASGHAYNNAAIPFWNTLVRLGFFIIVAWLLKTIQHTVEQLTSLARTDGLTRLLNARSFKEKAGEIFDLASRHNHPLALGFIDLDGFKSINDRLGHSTGDQVLKSIAEAITKRLRSSDICARLGGDEFSVLLPETDRQGAEKFFSSLHQSLLEHTRTRRWPVGFSMGVAVFTSYDASVDEAIRFADSLMYQVKHRGKNSIHIEEYRGHRP